MNASATIENVSLILIKPPSSCAKTGERPATMDRGESARVRGSVGGHTHRASRNRRITASFCGVDWRTTISPVRKANPLPVDRVRGQISRWIPKRSTSCSRGDSPPRTGTARVTSASSGRRGSDCRRLRRAPGAAREDLDAQRAALLGGEPLEPQDAPFGRGAGHLAGQQLTARRREENRHRRPLAGGHRVVGPHQAAHLRKIRDRHERRCGVGGPEAFENLVAVRALRKGDHVVQRRLFGRGRLDRGRFDRRGAVGIDQQRLLLPRKREPDPVERTAGNHRQVRADDFAFEAFGAPLRHAHENHALASRQKPVARLHQQAAAGDVNQLGRFAQIGLDADDPGHVFGPQASCNSAIGVAHGCRGDGQLGGALGH